MALVILASVIGICLVILFLLTQRTADPRKLTPTSSDPETAKILKAVHSELSKLKISGINLGKASEAVGRFVSNEISRNTDQIEKRLAGAYKDVISSKDKTLKTLEQKVEEVSADFRVLGREKKQTESVVRSLSEGVIVVNAKGETLMLNATAEKMLGVKKEEVLGKPIGATQKEGQVISFAHRMEASESAAIDLLSNDPKAEKLIRESSAVIETESGQTMGMFSVVPEVTGKKELEDYKTEFLASVTHELRAPLICIQKSLAALDGELTALSEDQRSCLSIATRNAVRLEKLVNSILDFSRLEAGAVRLHTEPFRLVELIHDTVTSFKIWAKDKGIRLSVDIHDETLMVEADRERLQQVLVNLVGNAFKFTPKGGAVTLSTLFYKDPALAQGTRTEFVQIAVMDNGAGISEKDQKRIFEKFAMGSSVPLENQQGTGLGLAIAKEIVERHGGRIWVESEPGKGSSFRFVIPQLTQTLVA
ncbi:MAG: ATP-binding protein [Candidatus Omnitrophota bacterium]|nr:ATP-binding protein [Candidatus Omnitrophota bacterium]